MYILSLFFSNAKGDRSVEFSPDTKQERIRKWTILPSSATDHEFLQVAALACGNAGIYNHLLYNSKKGALCHEQASVSAIQGPFRYLLPPFSLESVMSTHPHDRVSFPVVGGGVRMDCEGKINVLRKKECLFLPSDLFFMTPRIKIENSRFFLLGYGPKLTAHYKTDDFDFTNPYYRITRFHSLFNTKARITDPIAFLNRIHYRGVRWARITSRYTLERLCKVFKEHLSIDTGNWTQRACDFERIWSRLYPWQQELALPALDAARHLMDAFPKCKSSIDMPGVILFSRPDRFCPKKIFPQWIMLMDQLLPNMQFVLTLSDKHNSVFPNDLSGKTLSLIRYKKVPEAKKPARVPSGAILLIDIDGRLPNLALMKLSTHFKDKGRKVILARKDAFIKGADAIYASCVFSFPSSYERVRKLKKYYGDSLIVGGSGVDIRKRLPREIENLPADYTLYPELGDRSIGFITRGCPFDCPFCIVPLKEGRVHQVSDINSLLNNGSRKLILLDDNILAHPKAGDFLEEMAMRNLQVNFTQSLDIRLIDREKAGILRSIHCANTRFTRTNYHFSLNDTKNMDQVRRNYDLLGFTTKDNVEFLCIYGYATSLEEDVERFRFLRSLPGAYVFVQQYRPIKNGPIPNLSNFFDDKADERIDELIKILFPQNMKSMEKYYKWVSKLYVERFGRLHMALVDTIFRYNYRYRRGQYIASMAGTIRGGV